MSNHILAAVFNEPKKPFVIRELRKPERSTGEVLVRVSACTLCGSDLHTYTGRRQTACPTILGHEILGVIEQLSDQAALDANGEKLAIGDRIVWGITVGCHECFYCRRALPQKCERLIKFGHERLTDDGVCRGGLATHCQLPANTVVCRVPEAVSNEVICPAGCATATVAACFRQIGNVHGASVLILGAGMLGLTAAAFAAVGSANQVLMVDVDDKRLELAKAFGTTHVHHSKSDADTVRDATNGYGVDVAIDMSGSPAALQFGLDSLRMGGKFLWVGAALPTPPLSIVPETIVKRQLCIQGIHNYRPQDLVDAVRFLSANHQRFPFDTLVDKTRFDLRDVNEAFKYADSEKPIRVMVNCT